MAWHFDSVLQNGRSIAAFAIAFGCLYESKVVGTLEGWSLLYDAAPMPFCSRDSTVLHLFLSPSLNKQLVDQQRIGVLEMSEESLPVIA
jgi:hypothetical protein